MATKIVTKNSSTASAVPTASDLVQGELAVNVADKRLFTEDNGGAIVELGTNPSTLAVAGEITANGGIALGDNDKATFGAGDDLQIYHDGSNSYISDQGTGNLRILGDEVLIANAANNEFKAVFNSNGAASLYYDSSAKLATTSTGIDVTGNLESDSVTIGVGSVATTEKLRVNGTVLTLGGSVSTPAIGIGDTNTGVYAPSTGELGWTVNGTQRLLLNSTGIGVTGTVTADGLTLDAGVYKINNTSVGSGADKWIGSDGGAGIFVNAGASGNFNVYNNNAVARLGINGSTGDISFYEDTGTTPKLFWDASAESLGIGTSSPSADLHIEKSNAAPRLIVKRPDGSNAADSGSIDLLEGSVGGGFGLTNNYGFRIALDGADNKLNILSGNQTQVDTRLTIERDSGNVGIGTSSPRALSHVYLTGGGSDDFNTLVTAYRPNSVWEDLNADTTDWQIFVDTGDMQFRYGDASTDTKLTSEAMRIDSSGNVGIGTSSPSQALHVSSASDTPAIFESTDYQSRIQLKDPTGSSFVENQGGILNLKADSANAAANSRIGFSVDNSEKMRIDSSGNLLVGKTSIGTANGVQIEPSGAISLNRDGSTPLYLNRKTSDGTIAEFRKDGTTVGSIGVYSGSYLVIESEPNGSALILEGSDNSGTTTRLAMQNASGSEAFRPFNSHSDALFDLGSSARRFKDLYLSGGVYLGGTGAANKLDDYEEGSFTATLKVGADTKATMTAAKYVKVGNLVSISIDFANETISAVGTSTGNVEITGLPFTAGGAGRQPLPAPTSLVDIFASKNLNDILPNIHTLTTTLSLQDIGGATALGITQNSFTTSDRSGTYFRIAGTYQSS